MAIPDPVPEFHFLDELVSPAAIPLSAVAASVDLRWVQIEEFLVSRKLAANTRKAYEREFRQFLSWTDQPWTALTVQDMARYQQWLNARRSPHSKPLTPATLNRSIAAVQSFFKWLTAQGYISQNPTLDLQKPQAQVKQTKGLNDTEVKALFAALDCRGEHQARDTALLRILEQGLKGSQVTAFNVQDYDGKQLWGYLANQRSTIALIPEARAAIDAYLSQRSQQGLPTAPDSPLLLSGSNNSKGQRLSYWGIYRVIAELAALAKVAGCSPQRLRHTFIQRMHQPFSGLEDERSIELE